MIDNRLSAVSKRLVFVNQERPVLIPEEKTGSNRIDSNAFAELLFELAGEALLDFVEAGE